MLTDAPKRASTKLVANTPATAARAAGQAGRKPGTGASTNITVKGRPASAKQRQVIDGCLTQARQDGASRRVMIAVVMCITQESEAGDLAGTMTGNDDVGIYQQGRNWISVAGSKQPGPSTHAFLITGPTSWKKIHGSVRTAPGSLTDAIHRVQNNKTASDYKPWEPEATKTVDAWLGDEGLDATDSERSVPQPYLYERGSKDGDGTRESSWDAIGRWAEEVRFRRWASQDTLFYVSDRELRAAAPSLQIDGDEAWIVPGSVTYSWGTINRPATEITLQVITTRWGLSIGAVVNWNVGGVLDGRYLVAGFLRDPRGTDPTATVTLRRPARPLPEPAHEVTTTSTTSEDSAALSVANGDGTALQRIKAACQFISDQKRTYGYGAGHGPQLASLKNSKSQLDCSSSTSLALHIAGLFGTRTTALVSGGFSGWGKPGEGDSWTVFYNAGHVFIQGTGWRFDTGGHPAESGPRYVTETRSTSGFSAAHLERTR